MSPKTFEAWIVSTLPSIYWPEEAARPAVAALERVASGEVRRLLLLTPPDPKLDLLPCIYASYRLSRPPARILIGAATQWLADLRAGAASAPHYEIPSGSYCRGVGVGAALAGVGADLIVLADPVRSAAELASPEIRDGVWSWFTNTLSTRLFPDAAMVLSLSTRHEDDLAARILASEDAPSWTVCTL